MFRSLVLFFTCTCTVHATTNSIRIIVTPILSIQIIQFKYLSNNNNNNNNLNEMQVFFLQFVLSLSNLYDNILLSTLSTIVLYTVMLCLFDVSGRRAGTVYKYLRLTGSYS